MIRTGPAHRSSGGPSDRRSDRRSSRPRRSGRAISTVLDAAVFLLLVSAAIGVLYTVPQSGDDADPDPDVAAETATTLATSIETIEYAPAPHGDPDATGEAGSGTRRDRGTIAELLVEATVANARLGEEPFTRAPAHERAVRNATRRTIRSISSDVVIQVQTRWRPLPGSGLRGGIEVGPDPPADADVHAATTAVPVGTATSSGAAQPDWSAGESAADTVPDAQGTDDVTAPGRAESLRSVAGRTGCSGLAHVLAARVVGTTFPPEQTTLSLRAGGDPAEQVRTQYATPTSALGQSGSIHAEMAPRQRNAMLASELAPSFESACEGYESPAAAAERAAPGTVVVSVRTWSP